MNARKSYMERWGHPRKPTKGIARAKRARKREEVRMRNEKYHAMSLNEQITRAKSRPGASRREIVRLEKLGQR